MTTSETILIAAGLAALAYVLTQASSDTPAADVAQAPDQPADTGAATATDWSIDGIMTAAKTTLGLWRPPAQYAGLIATAEQNNGLPTDLLARQLFQESHYRDDIINGTKRSSAGAMGIAQFMPATARDMGINPMDPVQAIPAAARYMASLYRRFGNWTEALAAYNWGMGNVSRKGLTQAPPETVAYYSQILADVNASNGQNIA